MSGMQTDSLQMTFVKKERIAKDTYSFYFQKPSAFDFLPGQYIMVHLPIHPKDGSGGSRKFTIASSPLERDLIITTKKGRSEFKKSLFSLHPAEIVEFTGPFGGFVLRDTDVFEHVHISGGIGITPFHSMISYVAEKKLNIPITLIACFSDLEHVVYYDELMNIAAKNKNITVEFVVGQPNLLESVINKYVSTISPSTYYIVGSPQMVEDTEELLEKMGISDEKIKVEEFDGYTE